MVARRRRGLLTTLSLALLAVGYVVVFFVPGQAAISDMRSDLHEKQQYIIDAARMTYAIKQTEQEIESAREQTQRWREGSPSREKHSVVFGQITKLASESGISITRLEPFPIKERDAVWQMGLKVESVGYFREVFKFIEGVEKLPTTIWVSKIELEVNESVRRSAEELAKLQAKDPEAFQNSKYLMAEISLMVFADNSKDSN